MPDPQAKTRVLRRFCVGTRLVSDLMSPIRGSGRKEHPMLRYALIFLVVALVAGALGFGGIAGAATGIAKILFLVFLILFVAALVFGSVRRPGV
jgi:uncharacterized membrane protein YtjA (UPF0391 family)